MPAPLARRLAFVALAVLAAGLACLGLLAPRLATGALHAAAHARGFAVTWRRFDVHWPPRVTLAGLLLRSEATGDTVLVADSLEVRLRALPLVAGHVRPASLVLARAIVRLPEPRAAVPDTLAPDADDAAPPDVAPAVRQRADALVRALLLPARTLPTLRLEDVAIARGAEPLVHLAALALTHAPGAEELAATGALGGAPPVPFDVLLRWQRDDRMTGRAEFRLGEAAPPSPGALVLTLDGRVTQDRRASELRVADGTRIAVGTLAATVSARVAAAGPSVHVAVDAPHLTAAAFRGSLPAALLGPLAGLELSGAFDWHAAVDVDLAHPDSVRVTAGVVPHGLVLDPVRSRPSLQAIAGPFTANIHLPHDRIVQRELSEANPHYRPLQRISPFLRDAVVTNEDGGFWRHHGFNTEAIGLAVAANLRAGAYKRGAGTITMQLARNLWLGHRRTLSRKGQEVALAWLLEHASGLGKERLLEIYLNVIEWGPDVHGADEAARYFFDRDAAELTLPEALFLTIVIPSPTRWRWRVSPDGALRPYARAQMHFIAGKMSAKGWLDPALVPPADSLRITLRGPARALFAAPDTLPAPADSTTDGPI